MADELTAEQPAAAAKLPGALILARHGEPNVFRKVRLSADEYRRYWANYELQGLRPGQTPPDSLLRFAASAATVVASTRQRSIDSAEVLAAGRSFAREAMLIEAPLPPPSLPAFVRMSPRHWGFLARFCWWFFNHHEGAETRLEAEARADRAAAMLVALAGQGGDVLVLAHGFFNFMIGRSLRRMGWRMTDSEGFRYWSMRRFERL